MVSGVMLTLAEGFLYFFCPFLFFFSLLVDVELDGHGCFGKWQLKEEKKKEEGNRLQDMVEDESSN